MRRALLLTAGQRGVTLLEVLITVIVTVIGLLGVVALQMRAYAVESESYQRAHAAILLEDMANRIRANQAGASEYADDARVIGAGDVESCEDAATTAALDLCEWGNLLRGAAETQEGNTVGAMMGARSCIRRPDPAVETYVITVSWQGTVATADANTDCAADLYGDGMHRALSTVVRIADLD